MTGWPLPEAGHSDLTWQFYLQIRLFKSLFTEDDIIVAW